MLFTHIIRDLNFTNLNNVDTYEDNYSNIL